MNVNWYFYKLREENYTKTNIINTKYKSSLFVSICSNMHKPLHTFFYFHSLFSQMFVIKYLLISKTQIYSFADIVNSSSIFSFFACFHLKKNYNIY